MLKLDDQTAKSIQRNYLGYCVIALAMAVIYLFTLYVSMNAYIRDELTKELIRSNMVIEQNTNYLKLNSK